MKFVKVMARAPEPRACRFRLSVAALGRPAVELHEGAGLCSQPNLASRKMQPNVDRMSTDNTPWAAFMRMSGAAGAPAAAGVPAPSAAAAPSTEPGKASGPAADPAVAELEADLTPSFEAMASIETTALKQLRAGISNVVKQQAILKYGFLAERHFEQEGSDAVLFQEVPPWISFTRISGYRYRQVTSISDPDDEFELYNEGVSFFGVPGASGWADRIGDVCIHYMGPRWAVFSKVFPFHEQNEAREAHEDVLLLGSTRHVMLTPHCAYRIGPAGINNSSTEVTYLTGDGSLPRTTTRSRTPVEVLRRLYLTCARISACTSRPALVGSPHATPLPCTHASARGACGDRGVAGGVIWPAITRLRRRRFASTFRPCWMLRSPSATRHAACLAHSWAALPTAGAPPWVSTGCATRPSRSSRRTTRRCARVRGSHATPAPVLRVHPAHADRAHMTRLSCAAVGDCGIHV